jgi:hypothetical protein
LNCEKASATFEAISICPIEKNNSQMKRQILKTTIPAALALFLVFGLSSCSKELENEPEFRQYPKEITIDNYREFIDAPQEVMDRLAAQEMQALPKRTSAGFPLENPSNLRDSRRRGLVVGYSNGSWSPLGNTYVRWFISGPDPTDVTSSSLDGTGHNYMLYYVSPGNLCFTHKGPASYSYSYSEWVDGLTALDLAQIARHRTNTTPFTRVQQYIAADVNYDGQITAADEDIIRDLILGVISELPSNNAPSRHQPVAYIESNDYDALQDELDNGDTSSTPFYPMLNLNCMYTTGSGSMDRHGIKLGDVNGSWDLN